MKRFLAISLAKTAMFFTKLLKRGGGTALPGLLAMKIDKNILTELTGNLKYGNIIITGTNGKTTTAKMVADTLTSAGMDVITNNSGSNLSRGLVSTLIARSNLTGKITKGDVGLFEIDEATMIEAVPMLNPKTIAVTNFFRDQLDRYGEVDKTAMLVGAAIEHAPEATIILNADDPLVITLADKAKKTLYFGIEDSSINDTLEMENENKDCPLCGAPLQYETRYFSHIGKYKCSKCSFKRPKPETTVFKIEARKELTNIGLHTEKKENLDIILNIPGFYNIYNALAAAAIASNLGIEGEKIKYGLETTTAAFGRMEKIQIKDKYVYLLLIKNPTGFTESLKSIVSEDKINILLALNDNFADGTDISWIWDAELELLKGKTKKIFLSGLRALELGVRLKYAESLNEVTIETNLKNCLEKGLSEIEPGETLYVLPTYTAMMEIRNLLVKQGYAQSFWI